MITFTPYRWALTYTIHDSKNNISKYKEIEKDGGKASCFKILNYEYNNKKAIIKENNPVASAKAKPKIAKLNNCPLI